MNLKPIFEVARRFAQSNSAGILTGIGAAGVVATAVMTGRQAYLVGMDASTEYHETVELIDPRDRDEHLPKHMLTTGYIVKEYWREFIPPALLGVVSVTAVLAAHRVGARKQAALVAALKITDELRTEYREKVVATLGKDKEEKMSAELAKDRIQRVPQQQVIILGGSEILFFDTFSGRAFKATMEDVKRAVNEINYRVNNHGWCSLSDFYDELGLSRTDVSDEFGWKQDELLEPNFVAVLLDDGRPACEIDFNRSSIRSFNRLG